jgi:hypothetical protein
MLKGILKTKESVDKLEEAVKEIRANWTLETDE